MYYRIDGSISESTLDGLIEVCNELQPLESLDLYIRGTGGELGVAQAMVDLLNKVSITNPVHVFGFEFLISSHFHLFFQMKAHSKTLSKQSYGMIHKASWRSELLEGGHMRKDDQDVFMKEYFTQTDSLKDLHKLVKFSSEEIKKFKNNQDVYIMPNRMEEMLSYNKTRTILKPIKLVFNETN